MFVFVFQANLITLHCLFPFLLISRFLFMGTITMLTQKHYYNKHLLFTNSWLCLVYFRLLSHRQLCNGVYPARRVACYLTLPRLHSSRWPADCWVWPASTVEEAVPAAVGHSMRAAGTFTTSLVSTENARTHFVFICCLLSPYSVHSVPLCPLRLEYCLFEPGRPQGVQSGGPAEGVSAGHDPTTLHISIHHWPEMSSHTPTLQSSPLSHAVPVRVPTQLTHENNSARRTPDCLNFHVLR